MPVTPPTTADHDVSTLAHVLARYELPGPHATAVIEVPVPGAVGDDFGVRWRSALADLSHLGAPPGVVRHMDDCIAQLDRRGHPLLVTADADGAALCWLGFDATPMLRWSDLPALVPALHQRALAPTPIVGAIVDRIGADVHTIGAFDVLASTTVEGEDEQIHKAASGGWSQARHQRHSEVIWDRNAADVAASIERAAGRSDARDVILTGDERAIRLVEHHISLHRLRTVARRQAGGRHEPATLERLRAAANELRAEHHEQGVRRAMEDLREELGQRDQAVAGSVAVLEAVNEHRVTTLFIDLANSRDDGRLDAITRSALAAGVDVVTGSELDLPDGIAAMLRTPYREQIHISRDKEGS